MWVHVLRMRARIQLANRSSPVAHLSQATLSQHSVSRSLSRRFAQSKFFIFHLPVKKVFVERFFLFRVYETKAVIRANIYAI